MRAENSKNYSPQDSIKAAHLKKKLQAAQAALQGESYSSESAAQKVIEKPAKPFRDRLVDFLMYTTTENIPNFFM